MNNNVVFDESLNHQILLLVKDYKVTKHPLRRQSTTRLSSVGHHEPTPARVVLKDPRGSVRGRTTGVTPPGECHVESKVLSYKTVCFIMIFDIDKDTEPGPLTCRRKDGTC